ncbi:MAG: GH3 auxin-responsive promoter family protein, partial [Peptococcaceae bacterium]|nr:GH3 auxin-responsive promoter family protein [Peptococcaceae bacterium]
LPLEQKGNKDVPPLCMWEVEKGKHYELMITTYSGLYRYNMLDVVKVVDFVGRTPIIVFCGKSSEQLIVDGKTIYGYQIADIIQMVERQLDIEFDLVQAFVTDNGYAVMLETKNQVNYDVLKQTIGQVAKAQCGYVPDTIYIMDHQYKDSLFTERTRIDRGACGIKLPIVISEVPKQHIMQVL